MVVELGCLGMLIVGDGRMLGKEEWWGRKNVEEGIGGGGLVGE